MVEDKKNILLEGVQKCKEEVRDSLEMLVDTVTALIDRHNLSELSISLGEVSLSCKANLVQSHNQSQSIENTRPQSKNNQPTQNSLTEIRSDSVGTIYLSPSPTENPYIMVGSRIVAGQTLFIIEAMKVMNHFKSPCNGVVKAILVRNEQVIEYGQVLVKVE
jgi:acetyl-CoA carboxylase biotin carboxyl carrier protein